MVLGFGWWVGVVGGLVGGLGWCLVVCCFKIFVLFVLLDVGLVVLVAAWGGFWVLVGWVAGFWVVFGWV